MQVGRAGFSPSSLLEALAEQSLRSVSEKVVKDAQVLLLPPASHHAPWDEGMEVGDSCRIEERKAWARLQGAGGEIYSEANI